MGVCKSEAGQSDQHTIEKVSNCYDTRDLEKIPCRVGWEDKAASSMKELLGQVGKGLTYRSHHKAAFEPHSQSWSIRDQNCRVSYGLEGRVDL